MASHPVTVTPDQGLPEIQRIFASKGFRHLPVVNETGRLVGIVSDRDILRYSHTAAAETASLSVRGLMTPKTFAATLDTTIYEIAQLMLAEHISALPMLSAGGDLIGIVTTIDILKGLIRRVPIELWV